jgi:hypothetical protein
MSNEQFKSVPITDAITTRVAELRDTLRGVLDAQPDAVPECYQISIVAMAHLITEILIATAVDPLSSFETLRAAMRGDLEKLSKAVATQLPHARPGLREYDLCFKYTKDKRVEHIKATEFDEDAIKAAGETSGVVRLYQDGDVIVSDDVTDPLVRDAARNYGLSVWDNVFPEEAEAAKRLSRELLEAIDKHDVMTKILHARISHGEDVKQFTAPLEQSGQTFRKEQLPKELASVILPWVLQQKQTDGVLPGAVAFVRINGAAFLFQPIPLYMPYWKYRAYRVFEHVARKKNPDMIWGRHPGKRRFYHRND